MEALRVTTMTITDRRLSKENEIFLLVETTHMNATFFGPT